VLVIGVNTTRPTRHKDGEVSREQVERVVQRLQGVPANRLRIVVTHQPAWVTRKEDEPDRLHGGEMALQAWARAGADLVLGGHIHLPYVADLAARPQQPTPRRTSCGPAGTAVSQRPRHAVPNSLNVIRWEPPSAGGQRMVRVERWDYDVADARFEETHVNELKLGE
jgi:3',5'-cyclic AMP phosphodiesterase CpdA